MTARYEIRAATPGIETELLRLARHLNTVNLPASAEHIGALLATSELSFSGTLEPFSEHKYVFVLWDTYESRAVGTSTLVAQLGRKNAPYIYLSVIREEKYSKDLDQHYEHTALRLGRSFDGPTELAGLVLDPAYRGSADKLGRLISFVRFLFVKAHRERFRDDLLAELLPPLQPDGTSLLWEALGRRFVNMSYAEADLLSSQNKDFISDLFPSGLVYTSLMAPEAQAVVGQVGPNTLGVARMLERIGFRYARRVDPFDGGPHYTAKTDNVTLCAQTLSGRLRHASVAPATTGLLARSTSTPPYFVATQALSEYRAGEILAQAASTDPIGLEPGQQCWMLPL